MATLFLQINKQTLTASYDVSKLVEGNIEPLKFEVQYSKDWENLTKEIIFSYDGKKVSPINEYVPDDVLLTPGFQVNINGYDIKDGMVIKRITTLPISVFVYPNWNV